MSWFNQKQNAVLGLDISTAAVKLLELSKLGTRYRVESYTVVPLLQEAFVDKNIANIDMIAEAIRLAVKQSGTKLRQACVAVSGSTVMSKVITVPVSLAEEEIEDQVLDEAAQYVPYTLDEVSLDFEVQRVNETNPQMLDVLLVASRKENVNNRVEALTKAGLKTKIVDVEAFAIENALILLNDQLEGLEGKTYAVADVGASMTTLSIIHDGRTVYTREQGFGGKQLTEEIQRRYGFSYEEAGLAKKRGGLPESYTADVLEPFKKVMVQQISRSMQFFVSSSANRNVDGIVLAGGCATISGVDALIEQSLGVTTYIANPFISMALSNKVKPQTLSADAPALLLACGLALRSFD
ncbi:MAG: pilus assembly protein PilM [Methyloglobulus sp.]|nr:pilus assembly protein PilM [Methyloglobulus sp.]